MAQLSWCMGPAWQVRESLTAGVYVEGLREVVVVTVDEALALVHKGASHRHTAETKMNRESSRSHSVFTAVVTSQVRVCFRSILTQPHQPLSGTDTSWVAAGILHRTQPT
jgi:hypothetical protein